MTNSGETRNGHVDMLNPEGLVQSPAFSNVAIVSGPVRTIYVGGQDAVDAEGNVVGEGDLAAQTAQVLANIKTALAAAGASPEHVVKWNLFVVEGQDITAGYTAFQSAWGKQSTPPPVITAAFVKALARPEFLVEMDAIAVVPEESAGT
jgi:enamine deaminase RidA (YjgF/YER057c/UK114 family)